MRTKAALRIVLIFSGVGCVALWIVSRLTTIQTTQNTSVPPSSTPIVSATGSAALPQASTGNSLLENSQPASTSASTPRSPAPRAVPAFVVLRVPVFLREDDSKMSGEVVAIPAGTKVTVVKVEGSLLQVEREGKYKYVPITDTDFFDRLAGKVR
jgi:hypothetical protein